MMRRLGALRLLLADEGGVTVPQLAERLDCSQNYARRVLHRLFLTGFAREAGRTERDGRPPPSIIYRSTHTTAVELSDCEASHTGRARREDIDSAPLTVRRAPRRPRSAAGSGVIAGRITVGRGTKWGAGW